MIEDEKFQQGIDEIMEKIDEEKSEERKSWARAKELIRSWAKMRMGEILRAENGMKDFLTRKLEIIMQKVLEGEEKWSEYHRIKSKIGEIWNKKSKKRLKCNKSKEDTGSHI